MTVSKNTNIKNDDLKKQVLGNEKKKKYFSSKFKKIENRVLASLKLQKTDEALKDVTIWALVIGSSDIHYEVYETSVTIRFRIDWFLVPIFNLKSSEYKLILERLKYSAGLKLNITNIPQDGKYVLGIENKKIDVRVSTLPTKYWENVVCRLLDSSIAI